MTIQYNDIVNYFYKGENDMKIEIKAAIVGGIFAIVASIIAAKLGEQ